MRRKRGGRRVARRAMAALPRRTAKSPTYRGGVSDGIDEGLDKVGEGEESAAE